MATPAQKTVSTQQAKRLLQKLADTPVQTVAGMATYLEAGTVALEVWIESSHDLGPTALGRHITLLRKCLVFRHLLHAWYKKRGSEDEHNYLFKKLDNVLSVLAEIESEHSITKHSPSVEALLHALIFFNKALKEAARELAYGTLMPLFDAAPDDGIISPVHKRTVDAAPSWPMTPFSSESREHDYSNHIFGKWEIDPRERYIPSRENVATFRRWDRSFNPWGPNWRDWEGVLIQHCGLKLSQCEELGIPQILAQLDNTPIENEMEDATAFLQKLAAESEALEAVEMGEHEKTWYRELLAAHVSDLLLKVHDLDRRDLYTISHVYPGGIKFEEYCAELARRLGTKRKGPMRQDVTQLLFSVATALIPWCGEDAVQAQQALEQVNGVKTTITHTRSLPHTPIKYYTAQQAAGKLGVAVTTVTRWCKDNRNPCHKAKKIGGTWRIPQDDILQNRA